MSPFRVERCTTRFVRCPGDSPVPRSSSDKCDFDIPASPVTTRSDLPRAGGFAAPVGRSCARRQASPSTTFLHRSKAPHRCPGAVVPGRSTPVRGANARLLAALPGRPHGGGGSRQWSRTVVALLLSEISALNMEDLDACARHPSVLSQGRRSGVRVLGDRVRGWKSRSRCWPGSVTTRPMSCSIATLSGRHRKSVGGRGDGRSCTQWLRGRNVSATGAGHSRVRCGCAQIWPWGWCVVNSTSPTSSLR